MMLLILAALFTAFLIWCFNRKEEHFADSSNAPAPNLPLTHTGELCSQCIGNCHMRIWAGIYKQPEGKTEKEFCTQKCYDICVNFD